MWKDRTGVVSKQPVCVETVDENAQTEETFYQSQDWEVFVRKSCLGLWDEDLEVSFLWVESWDSGHSDTGIWQVWLRKVDMEKEWENEVLGLEDIEGAQSEKRSIEQKATEEKTVPLQK